MTGASVKMRPATRSGVFVVSVAFNESPTLSMNCVIVSLNVAFMLTWPSEATQSST